MAYKTDIEIAREANKKPIQEIGAKLGIGADDLLPYGHDKAKVSQSFIDSVQDRPNGKLVLVTAINPTPAGDVCLYPRGIARAELWHEGRGCWRRPGAGCSDGRHEPAFHR